MKARAELFPVVAFSSQVWILLFIAGIFMSVGTVAGSFFVQLAVILFGAVLAFHMVTLPVEVNASTRAYGLLTCYGILSHTEAGGTKCVLTAALTTLLTFLDLLFVSQNE